MRRRIGRLAMLLGAVAVLLGALAGPASAHATVEFTDPPDGMRLAAAPASVLVAFSESVSLSAGYLQVVDSAGARVDHGDPAHPPGHGEQLTVALRAGLGSDVYVMSWRVVSVDSHVVSGSARFAVGDAPFTAQTAGAGATGSGESSQVAATAAQAVMFAGLALLAGLWALWLAPIGEPALRRARRVAAAGWVGATTGLAAGLLVQGAQSSGRGLGSVWRLEQLRDTAGTRSGQLSLWALGGLILVGALLPRVLRAAGERRVHGVPEAAGVALLGSAAALAATGHAASLGQPSVALAANAAHLVAAMVWLGGVATLGLVLLPGIAARDSRGAAARFLPVAATSVIVLALTGVYQGWQESASLDALVSTTYGRLVLTKAALLVLLVGVAAIVRARWAARANDAEGNPEEAASSRPATAPAQPHAQVQGAFRSRRADGSSVFVSASATESAPAQPWKPARAQQWGPDGGPARVWRPATPARVLGRWIVVELLVGAAALAVAATLVGQTPARAAYAEQQASRPVTAHAQLSDGRSATVTIDPARHGTVSIVVQLDEAASTPASGASSVQPERASLQATHPGAVAVGPLDIALSARGGAGTTFGADQVQLPIGGTWVLDLTVAQDQFDAASAQFKVALG